MSGEKGAGDHLSWLVEHHRGRELEVLRSYKTLAATCPMVMKDLEILCCVKRGTLVPGDRQSSDQNEGMRVAYLHIKQMIDADINKDDAILKAYEASQQKGQTS